ncbi:MAG: Do family serine endopeptidase [Fibrobacter sp.]|nr:Do family serine endopeptidase [Fibrobacter sp.]
MKKTAFYPAMILILTAGIYAISSGNTPRPAPGSVTIGAKVRPVKDEDIPEIKNFNQIFVRVASSVIPSVVAVIPTRVDSGPTPGNEGDLTSQDKKEKKHRVQALGSGVIVSPEGYILTNDHVISGAQEIDIHLSDGRIFKAAPIGSDSLSDVAVLKIKGTAPKNLPVAYLGNSDSLHPGDWVAAIGNPFSLLSTITQGIISALQREVSDVTMYQNFIQTDAAINPGNSGGALVNVYGEVIGINTLIYSQDGSFIGIGFAIPINMAKKVLVDLIYKGRVIRGWIGLSIQELTNEISQALGMQSVNGVLVSDVYSGQPAEKAGLKRGDVILYINNQQVKTGNDLRNIVASIQPGTEVPVIVFRGGKKIKLMLKVTERTPQALEQTNSYHSESLSKESKFDGIDTRSGISVTDLNVEIRQTYNIAPDIQGAMVTNIKSGFSDARATLLPGDIIIEASVQGKKPRKITTGAQFHQFVATLKNGDLVMLLINRTGNTFYIPFEFKNP